MGRVQNVLTFTYTTVTEKKGTRKSDSKKENIQSGQGFQSSLSVDWSTYGV